MVQFSLYRDGVGGGGGTETQRSVSLAIQLLRPRAEVGLGGFPTAPNCHIVLGMAGRGVTLVRRRGWRTDGKLFAKAAWGKGAFYKTRASGLETSVSLQISEETFASPENLNHVPAGEEQALAWRLQTHSPVLSGTWS